MEHGVQEVQILPAPKPIFSVWESTTTATVLMSPDTKYQIIAWLGKFTFFQAFRSKPQSLMFILLRIRCFANPRVNLGLGRSLLKGYNQIVFLFQFKKGPGNQFQIANIAEARRVSLHTTSL